MNTELKEFNKRKHTMNKGSLLLLLVMITTTLEGCMNKKEQPTPDSFYESFTGYDYNRIPLIKPYELRTYNPQDGQSRWDIAFVKLLGTYNVKKVDVQDSIIYILSGNVGDGDSTFVNRTTAPTGWFIIDARLSNEKGFLNQNDFNDYILQHQYPNPLWMDIDSLADSIRKKNKLPWKSS
jgi:hypothetical protein